MTKLKEDLWETLENLRAEQFKHFQWFLKEDNIMEGTSAIPEAQLERADRQDTVDLMVQKHGRDTALEMTKMILQKINRNDLVERLTSTSSRLRDHRNHNSVLLKREYKRTKATLGDKIKLMIQGRQMKIGEIKHSAELSRKSAYRQTEDSKQVFTMLLQSVEETLANIIAAIEEKQKTTQKEADGYIQQLEKEISELATISTEVEQLSCIEDHREFLQSCPYLNDSPSTKNWAEVSIPPPSYGRSVGSAVNQLKEQLSKQTEKLLAKAKLNRVQQFAVDVTLDPDTANPRLILSENGKQVYYGIKEQNLPDNPERFNTSINVLGKQSISSGRFYYEVQVEGKTSWDLGVVKESINRKGSIHVKPENGYWTMCLRDANKYKAFAAYLSVKSPPKKVGVFVDYENGSVSFFDVDSAGLLHSFKDCSFTEKLYPFFSPGLQHTPLIISSVNYID